MTHPNDAHILAVDDSADNLFLLESILSECDDYRVSFAEDGGTALEKVTQSPPDLLLLDIMMPGIDGYEVTRRIRQNERLPYIPILLITAHDQSSVV
ncbi:MAG: response regulator, partial [Leptolyngbya sp. SIO4C1]|nr:response regulator [Leptolyngbya sp. SIO4C1]